MKSEGSEEMGDESLESFVRDAVHRDRLAVVHGPQEPAQVPADVWELGQDLPRALRGGSAAFELVALRRAPAAATNGAIVFGRGIEIGFARRGVAAVAAAGRRLARLTALLLLLLLLLLLTLLLLLVLPALLVLALGVLLPALL